MTRRAIKLLVTLALGCLVAPLTAAAQPVGKVYRIGYLAVGLSPTPAAPYQGLEAFRLVLRDLGYVEGKNLLMEYRWGERKPETLPDLAAELVRLQVDLIVVPDTPAALAAKHATQPYRTHSSILPADEDRRRRHHDDGGHARSAILRPAYRLGTAGTDPGVHDVRAVPIV
jgi:hypothetical protein